MNTLLQYIPKYYRPCVVDIEYGDRVWNEYTKRWNKTIDVTWQVGDEVETATYQNASYMFHVLKEFGNDFVDSYGDLTTL